MPKAKSPPRSARAKASRPDLAPLDEHLAALLNPALNDKRKGFEEAPQAPFDLHAAKPLARQPDHGSPRMPSGAAATADVLQKLLETGDPRITAGSAWVPHRPARPEKSEGGYTFRLSSEYEPKGDQPTAIRELVEGIQGTERDQVLLGVTGSGKTYTMAQVIARTGRPALILAPNKTWRRSSTASSRASFPTTRWNISSPTTITTSPRPMCRARTPISRRNPPSTSRSTACATRPRARCWSATTSSSSPPSPASTVSARSRPTRP